MSIKENRELVDKMDKMELRQKYASLMEIEDKIAITKREHRIIELTLQELKSIEGDAKFYESHGRAYVRNYKKEVVNHLESQFNAKTSTIDNLQKNQEKRAAELQLKKN